MPTRETRRLRGERRGRMLLARAINEIQTARELGNVSLEQLAREVGSSPSAMSRLERQRLDDIGVVRLSEIACVLGYEISLGFHPARRSGARQGTADSRPPV